jgi:hypothetical protein
MIFRSSLIIAAIISAICIILSSPSSVVDAAPAPTAWSGCWNGGASNFNDQFFFNISAKVWPATGPLKFYGNWTQVKGPLRTVKGKIDNGTLTTAGLVSFAVRYMTGDSVVTFTSTDGTSARNMQFCNTYQGTMKCKTQWYPMTGGHTCVSPSPARVVAASMINSNSGNSSSIAAILYEQKLAAKLLRRAITFNINPHTAV